MPTRAHIRKDRLDAFPARIISRGQSQISVFQDRSRNSRPAVAITFSTASKHDSRKMGLGDLFVALETPRRDGHDFVAAATAVGAAGALVSRWQPEIDLPQLVVEDPLAALHAAARRHREQFPGTIIGITGSCGKTSTKELLTRLLGPDRTAKTPGNFNNLIGVPLSLLQIDPDRHQYGVIEAGINRPGEMRQLAELIQPDHVIVTMIGPAHLELLGSLQGIAAEKAQLLSHPRTQTLYTLEETTQWPAFSEFSGSRVVLAEHLCRLTKLSDQVSYEIHSFKDGGPSGGGGAQIDLRGADGAIHQWRAPSVSPGMWRNAVLALRVAGDLGIDPGLLQERLQNWRPAVQRGSWREAWERQFYVDCYNANPASFADAFIYFDQAVNGSPRTFVLGGMKELGPDGPRWHREVGGRVPAKTGDSVIFVGDEAAEMAAGWQSRWPRPLLTHCATVPSVEAAREVVATTAGPVFLKGSRAYRLEALLAEPRESEVIPC